MICGSDTVSNLQKVMRGQAIQTDLIPNLAKNGRLTIGMLWTADLLLV